MLRPVLGVYVAFPTVRGRCPGRLSRRLFYRAIAMNEPPPLSSEDAVALDEWMLSGGSPRGALDRAFEYAAEQAGVDVSEARVSIALASDDSPVGRAGRWTKHYLNHLRIHDQPPTRS